MTWQSYCQLRADRCDACADATSDVSLVPMFRRMAEDWRSAAQTLPDVRPSDRKFTSPPAQPPGAPPR
jgi:hypothetical protein